MEKKISKKDLLDQIREEWRLARKFVSLDHRRYTYAMMLDTDDGEIWSDTFTDCNSFKRYRSSSIQRIIPIRGWRTVPEGEEAYLDAAIEMLTDAGWEVE